MATERDVHGIEQTDASISRAVTVAADSAAVWEALVDPMQRAAWLAPVADLDVSEGGRGHFVDDDGVERDALVEHVDEGSRLVFAWWPRHDRANVSRVELVLMPAGSSTHLIVTETRIGASPTQISGRASASDMSMRSMCSGRSTRSTCSMTSGWVGRLLALGFVVGALVRV